MQLPLWIVRLQRDAVKRVTQHVVAKDADAAMRMAQAEHQRYTVVSVERVTRIGVYGVESVLVARARGK